MAIKVLIVDDHEAARLGLQTFFDGSPIKVVGEATSGTEALTKAKRLKPDVVLLDVRMPEGDGLLALDQIRSALPGTRVIMLSGYTNPTYIAKAKAMGASGYVLKTCTRQELIKTIKVAMDRPVSANLGEMEEIAAILDDQERINTDEFSLTPRESQTMRHLAYGLSNREIAHAMDISYETVKEHIGQLMRKTGYPDRTKIAVWAVENEIV
jgi:DNA-binding NarL/FixJ family response regulator